MLYTLFRYVGAVPAAAVHAEDDHLQSEGEHRGQSQENRLRAQSGRQTRLVATIGSHKNCMMRKVSLIIGKNT